MKILSANRNFYLFGIFFAALLLFLALFQNVLYLQIGIKTRYLQSFPSWFLVFNLVVFIGLFIQFTYYYLKKFWLALSALLLFGGASFVHAIVVYFVVTEQRLEGYFISTYNLLLLTSMVYGTSLIFSHTGKRIWLRTAGVFMLVLSIALTGFFLWRINTPSFELRLMLDKIHAGVSMLGSLLPIPFLLNFRNELRELGENKILTKTVKATFLFIVVFALIPSVQLARDSFGNILHENNPSVRAVKLAEPFEERSFTNDEGETLPYRLLKPLNHDPNKKYPLAVCLHHGGGNGTENVIQIETSQWAQTLAEPVNLEKYPSFIFVPQCPPASSFGGIPNYPEMSELVFEAIAELEKEFAIDERRRYVMGVSLGGFGSWHFIGTHPNMFAAAIPVCGGGNPEHAKNMTDIPIWAFHGAEDSNVPVDLSRAMIEGIRASGGNPKYSEFEDVGHNIWRSVEETPGKLEWLFAQQRK